MTTTPANPDALIAALKQKQAAHGDGRDARSDNEKAAHWATARTIAQTITGLMNAPGDLERAERRLADVEASRARTIAKQAEIEEAIRAAPPWREHADARERDRRFDHIHHLRRALERLRVGTLLAAPDVCYEPLDYLDRRLAELTDRRDRARAALDGHLRAAEQLIAAVDAATITS